MTIAFSEKFNSWTTRYSFEPTCYSTTGNKMVSFNDNGKVWLHDSNEDRCNFYDNIYGASIEVVSNQDPSAIKMFKSISLETNGSPWSGKVFTNDEYSGNEKQEGDILSSFFKNKEGFKYSEMPRSKLSSSNIYSALCEVTLPYEEDLDSPGDFVAPDELFFDGQSVIPLGNIAYNYIEASADPITITPTSRIVSGVLRSILSKALLGFCGYSNTPPNIMFEGPSYIGPENIILPIPVLPDVNNSAVIGSSLRSYTKEDQGGTEGLLGSLSSGSNSGFYESLIELGSYIPDFISFSGFSTKQQLANAGFPSNQIIDGYDNYMLLSIRPSSSYFTNMLGVVVIENPSLISNSAQLYSTGIADVVGFFLNPMYPQLPSEYSALSERVYGGSYAVGVSAAEVEGDQIRGPYARVKLETQTIEPFELHAINVDYEFSKLDKRLTQNS